MRRRYTTTAASTKAIARAKTPIHASLRVCMAPTLYFRVTPGGRSMARRAGAACRMGGGITMELKSPAFAHGAPIPPEHTCDGRDISPPLSITGPAPGTRSLALIADDPDAPMGTWVH